MSPQQYLFNRLLEGGPLCPPSFATLEEYYRFLRNQVTFWAETERPTSESTESRRAMNISIKPPELTQEQREALKVFYKQTLERGYAYYPLPNDMLVIWIDGRVRAVRQYDYMTLTDQIVYLANSRDEGDSSLRDPGQRFAIILALMSQTGHASDPELQGLVEQRLAKILAGTYQAAVAPLGQRPDGRPVERIAWSMDGGLAAQIGDEWLRPVTGEPVQVGSGWVVLDVARDKAELVRVEETVPVIEGGDGYGGLREFAEHRGYQLVQFSEGLGIACTDNDTAVFVRNQASESGHNFRVVMCGYGEPAPYMVTIQAVTVAESAGRPESSDIFSF